MAVDRVCGSTRMSFMVNMLTGETNKIHDNGKAFTQKVWIIPPDELAEYTGFGRPQ